MKNVVIKIMCLLLFVSSANNLLAQKMEFTYGQILKGEPHEFTKNIPIIIGWADRDNYIEKIKGADSKIDLLSLVNVRTGIKKPYNIVEEKVTIEKNDIFYIDNKGEKKQLTKTESEEKNPTLSPDKKWIAFTRDNNLYTINIETGKEVQYTFDGSDVILNGYASWVYYEEILGRSTNYKAYWWSPDSKSIAFFRSDDSDVPVFPIYSAEGQHGFLETMRYPKAGDPNPQVKVGIIAVEGRDIVWADFDEKGDQYFGQPFWTNDSKSVWLQWMPREQDNLKIFAINPRNGTKEEVYNEYQPTWVDWKSNIIFLANNEGYLIQNDTDGWDQIYLYTMDGKLKQKLTNGNLWRTRVIKVDESTKTIYYTSYAENATRNDLYSVKFNGQNLKRLTFGEYSHQIRLSPDAKYYITNYSNTNTPPRLALYDINKSKIVKELYDSKGSDFDNYIVSFPKIEWIETPDGFNIPAIITLPHNMDQSKKYPVLISIYGGPNSAKVYDVWRNIDNQLWAKEGIIQVIIDHRGSGHSGKKGLNYMHRSLGKWEMEDYIQWVKFLHDKPYVDKNKICINGGSYGGYLTALALTYGAEYFNYGIADFGVMDWLLYDSHYTERYMDTPKSNSDGYKKASVFTYIDNYKGGESMLRIVHGTTDDNVHLQNSVQLVKKLQDLNKTFEMMFYPDCRHGWRGMQRVHDMNESFRFYFKYLLNKEVPKDLFL